MSSVDVVAAPAAVRGTPGSLRRQLGAELRLVFGRRRNLALLVVLAAAPLLIGIAVKVSAPPAGKGPAFLSAISGNGLFLVFTALTVSVPLFLPLIVAVAAGDAIAGEAGTGTLRYLLTIPVSRTRLLAVKSLVVLGYTTAAVLAVAVVGLLAGWALFGLRAMTLLSGDVVPLWAGLARAFGVAVYVVVALTGLIAIGMFLSTLTEVPIAAMAATLGVAIVANVLEAVPQLGSLRQLLFTHYWLGFGELLRLDVDTGALARWSSLQLAYVALFGSLAWARFTSRDVTS